MRQLFRELKRRNIYRVAATYAVVAFIVWQASSFLLPALGFPEWSVHLVVVLTLLGFPVAVVLAWAFEVTPDGMRRTEASVEARTADDSTGRDALLTEPAKDRDRRRVLLAGVGAGILLAAAGLGIASWYLNSGPPDSTPEEATVASGSALSVAVLPFRVSGSGVETWREGMVTVLSTGLDGAAGLRTIDEQTVLSRWERSFDAGGEKGEELDLAVARELGATYALIGSAVALGPETRFVVEVHRTDTGISLGQAQVEGPPDSVMSLADELTREVLRILLKKSDDAIPSVDLASLTTNSIPALKSYLEGERHYRRGEFDAAVERYREAVRADSTFALAHWRLSRAYSWKEGAGERSRSSLLRALEMADRLPVRERRLVRADHLWNVQGDPRAARDTLRRLTETYPDEPQAWYLLGEVLFHSGVPGGYPEAERVIRRSVALDPDFTPFRIHHVDLALVFYYDSALAAQRLSEVTGGEPGLHVPTTAISLAFGTPPRRRAAIARLDSLDAHDLEAVSDLLLHPRAWRARETVLLEIRGRGDPELSSDAAQNLLGGSLEQGLWQETAEYLAQDELTDEDRICTVALRLFTGVPMPESLPVEPGVSFGRGTTWTVAFCSAVYALERQDKDLLRAARARLRSAAEEDPTAPALRILEAYAAFRAGDAERALRLADENREVLGSEMGLWLGDLHRDLGHLERAEGWYLGQWSRPVAHERLGQLYEEMDRPEEAAAAYRRFIAAWEDADPELQDRVEKARERLQELTGAEDVTDE